MKQLLAELFEKYYKDVYTYLYSLCHDASLSEDLTSEVFLEVVRSISTFRGESDIKTWLFSIARHKWYAYLRRKNRQLPTQSIHDLYDTAELGTTGEDSAADVASMIREMLSTEPELTQNIIQMRLDGYSYYEIAAKYGLSENSARVVYFRAKAKIKNTLKRRDSAMNKISCDMCIDLMPLVQDGVASQDSRTAVLHHIAECPDCKTLFEGEIPTPSDNKEMLAKVQKKAQIFSAMVMMFGIFYGLMLTASNGIFYNVMIMPVIGAIGYYLFRWKGLYIIPALLLVTHFVTNALGLGGEYLDILGLLMWTAIYCGVALVGFVIAALLHFVFRKEENEK